MSSEFDALPSPCYLLEAARLRENLQLIDRVQQASGCNIVLALKGFAMWSAFPMVREYLSGCSASSYNEARLAKTHFGGHVHLYAPAYSEAEFPKLLPLAERISFNSLSQWQRFGNQAIAAGKSCGLRVNPAIDEVATDLYNPCHSQSRLGISVEQAAQDLPPGIEGLHVHALCESDADASFRLIQAIEEKFAHWLPSLKWCNLGGGHLMTRQGYDVDGLIETLKGFRQRHPHLDIVLEPGSAIAWDSGPLVATVLDLIERGGIAIALLDVSATAHMPDILEMPYRAEVRHGAEPGSHAYTYRLTGPTCLAGDIIGDYAFEQPLQIGERIVFEDMIHYTMVKTTQFNGVPHPAIAIRNEQGEIEVIRQFGYDDYESRLS
ncbi:MAG: carboxynorspermidine decarboxylase [Candidatus Thiodiazotropha taylori]|nr:carboxynorspermidine decarboxylase [Candidatus Thiodiazotropha taylori]MCG7960771.1 carboxynorspermidine decarboxylase [Candidatus Thiodiazotropha taylori]MCG8091886.1 carboxynorspermidine decarboxylase [Candidatus Thiodiazotropha taylori]MCW4234340.1 carboxynorspermidine decarboxylase [Candidatus Thiodiazotropha taylori]MCW4242816.1 carboxynorspermidine decarboxylase [Candidatus Thiodiazotropha taylori]